MLSRVATRPGRGRDLRGGAGHVKERHRIAVPRAGESGALDSGGRSRYLAPSVEVPRFVDMRAARCFGRDRCACRAFAPCRSEEHTSELQSLMRISYDVFCLKKKTPTQLDLHEYVI